MAKRAYISSLLAMTLTFPPIASAQYKFVPPANVGSSKAADPFEQTFVTAQSADEEDDGSSATVTTTTVTTTTVTKPTITTTPIAQPKPMDLNMPALQPSTPTVQAAAQTQVVQADASGNLPNRPSSYFKPFYYADLRDIADPVLNQSALARATGNPKEPAELTKSSRLIIEEMNTRPERFTGPIVNGQIDASARQNLHFGVLAPEGAKNTNQEADEETGVKMETFVISNDNSDSRKNVILGATVESITEKLRKDPAGTKQVDMKLLLLVRDDSRGYTGIINGDDGVPRSVTSNNYIYFRRVSVSVDQLRPEGQMVVSVRPDGQDIPLADTKFELVGSLMDRKVVMMDRKHRIYKPFPIGVGSFDIKSEYNMEFLKGPADNKFADPVPVVETLTGEYPNAIITKASVWRTSNHGTNTRSRIHPHYYNGRPFIGIRDVNAGALANNDLGYKAIGMHYQIDADGLKRGFVSHGCIRVRDNDLYQLDAILNEGFHDALKLKLTNNFDDTFYDQFEPMMPKMNSSYYALAYSNLNQDLTVVDCRPDNVNKKFNVYWLGGCAQGGINSKGGCNLDYFQYSGYHTISDHECLPQTVKVPESVEPIIAYMKGQTTTKPLMQIRNWEHHPEITRKAQTGEVEMTEEEQLMRMEGSDNFSNVNLFEGLGSIFGMGPSQEELQRREIQRQQEQQVLSQAQQSFTQPQTIDQAVNCYNSAKAKREQMGCKNKVYKEYLLQKMGTFEKTCNIYYEQQNYCAQVYKQLQ